MKRRLYFYFAILVAVVGGLATYRWTLYSEIPKPYVPPPKRADTTFAELLVKADETWEKLEKRPRSWVAKIEFGESLVAEVSVVQSSELRSWTFAFLLKGHRVEQGRIIAKDGVWYVHESGHWFKSRPYEAELGFFAAYTQLTLSELLHPSSLADLDTPKFTGWLGENAQFQIRPKPADIDRLKDTFSKAAGFLAEGTGQQEATAQIAQLTSQIEGGLRYGVNGDHGFLSRYEFRTFVVLIEQFRWLEKEPEPPSIPNEETIEDRTRRWSDEDLENVVAVSCDPRFKKLGANPNPESFLLNVRTGERRRIPFRGCMSGSAQFFLDRHSVVLCGQDTHGRLALTTVNLLTGQNTPLGKSDRFRFFLPGEIAPDGTHLIGFERTDAPLDIQIYCIPLDGAPPTPIGRPSRLGSPASWLPDGSGLILKRFLETESPHEIAPTVVCRLDLSGNLADLVEGDAGIVLRKSRKFLFSKDRAWYLRDIEGGPPELIAHGTIRHGFPAISPDETRILFTRFEDQKLPSFVIVDIATKTVTSVPAGPGLVTFPVWR